MKILLIYPPFCTPTMLPYSISYLKNFLSNNCTAEIKCLDLNARFHYLRFPALHKEIAHLRSQKPYSPETLQKYTGLLETLEREAADVYSANNKRVVAEQEPELLAELITAITEEKPNIVAFSIVYSSQCFYVKALLDTLKEAGIPTIVGGPAVNSKIKAQSIFMKNEVELLEYVLQYFGFPPVLSEAMTGGSIFHVVENRNSPSDRPERSEHATGLSERSERDQWWSVAVDKDAFLKKTEKNKLMDEDHPYNVDTIPDFSDYRVNEYFWLEKMIPIKTCSTCFYKQCTFCTHFADVPYLEYNIDTIRETIIRSNTQYVFFIDDMITKNRLVELATMLKPLGVKWWCQLRPTKDLLDALEELHASGLHTVSWGVESGNQRILDLMKKGTQATVAAHVLQKSHEVGIRNATYIMFGFPTETKEEFLDTINFLKQNQNAIDLITTSIFGLQKGGKVYASPQLYGISNILEKERTVLDKSITYITSVGMQREEARTMRRKYIKTIKNIDKLPRILNYCKEQVLLW